ncbi:MAG: ADOP family duplicated permease [Gemmatimonadaceae bacterium]
MNSSGGWSRVRRAFRLPFSRRRIEEAVDAELLFHLQGRIDELVAAGMPREHAVAEARRRFGDYQEYRRQAREIDERTLRNRHRLELLSSFRREVRRSARSLLRTPAFSVVAVITLALGIGATTAIYTVLDAIVLRPLPYPDAHELVAVMHPVAVPGTGESRWGMSAAGYFYFRRENSSLADLGGYVTGNMTVSGDAEAERVRIAAVTHSVFSVLKAKAVVGRLILPDDDRPRGASVAVLGYDFWQRRYGGDPRVVGRVIETSEVPVQVIGVAERGLGLPKPSSFDRGADLAATRVDLWLPLQLDPNARDGSSHVYSGIGRLRPGVTAADAERDLQVLTRRFPELSVRAYSRGFIENYNFRVAATPLRDAVLGPRIARTLWVLLGAVGLVLVIACANVANLFLVRMEARRREAAIRTALGAQRSQLAMHYLSESLVIAVVAGTAAVLLAHVGVRALVTLAPPDLPRLSEVGVGWTSVALAAVLSITAGIVFGLFPVLRAGIDVVTLREGSRGPSVAPRQLAVRNGLVIAQVALALMLLAGAGLMLRSVARLRNVHPGLDPSGVLVFSVALPRAAYETGTHAVTFHRELQARLASLPGVRHVGAGSVLPLQDVGACSLVFREGRPYAPNEHTPCVAVPRATPEFFEALGVQVRGRAPDWADVQGKTGAVVVTKALADRLWPGEDPIGKGLNSGRSGPGPAGFYRVAGIIPELRATGLDQPLTEAVFYPPLALPNTWLTGEPMRGATYAIRSASSNPAALMPSVRRVVAELDPTVAIANPRTMTEVVERSMARVSFITTLLSIAAAMALLLSTVGIYGVISYVVAQRRPEIGIRMALGARVSQVSRLVVMESVRLAAIGVVLGLAGAVVVTRVLGSLLFEVSPIDPLVLALVALVLLAVAVLASFAPARRAASVDPVEAIRL